LDCTWSLELETLEEALLWLEPLRNNVGSYLTTTGRLCHPGADTPQSQQSDASAGITLEGARDLLVTLSRLFSFANGGYVGPLYLEGINVEASEARGSGLVLAFRTTPLEQVGPSWVAIDTDLSQYLSCYSSLARMLISPSWSETFDLVLMWYFQAIQPWDGQYGGKPWPVVASAVGAALERLSVAVVVGEFNERGLCDRDRMARLLDILGISTERGFPDECYIDPLMGIRNDATHPRPTSNLSVSERNAVLSRGIQWIEETLLWMLGYRGKYVDRTAEYYSSIGSRYDLSTHRSST
jgi:hypothetical protein